jgi:hypothetical protein
MNNKTIFPVIYLIFFIYPLLNADLPEICRVNGGNTKTIWGTGFTPGKTEVFVCDVPFTEKEAIDALEVKDYHGRSLLPVTPPAESKRLNIVSSDDRGLIIAVEFSNDYSPEGFYGDRIGGQVVWIKNQDGYSKPWLVHSANPWWVYPAKSMAGEKVRVFGRNMNAQLVVIRKTGDLKVQKLNFGGLVHNTMYETEVTLPKDLQPGEYELFVHNGSGGAAGWSTPLKLIIKPVEKSIKQFYNAKDFGAKGDSHTDDTKALILALAEAAKNGGTVILQPGCFIISETLELPFGVSLRGSGNGATSIQVLEDNPMRNDFPEEADLEHYAHDWQALLKGKGYAPMLWLRNKSTISDLTLEYGPGVGFGMLVARCNGVAEDIHIERTKVIANYQADGWVPSVPVFLAGNSYGLIISDNEFTGWGAIDAVANTHTQAYIGRNKFTTFPTGIANVIFLRGFNESIIESNFASFGIRNFATQLGTKLGKYENTGNKPDAGVSSTHVALIGNVFESNLARRHNDGEFMYESGNAFWHGKALTADLKTVTVQGEPFNTDMSDTYALILDGKGIGQYRHVISNTKNKLTFDKEWDIKPDETTYMVVGAFNADHLWIDNTEEHNASWTGFWGNNVGHVVDGHIMRDGGGLTLWAWDDKNPSTVAFVDFIGSRTIGRGGIAFLGSPVFGNTIRFCEIIDFRYKPNYHIQPGWLQGEGGDNRAGISISGPLKFEGIPVTAPLNGWNIIEGNHIYDGPLGITIDPAAENTILKKNTIIVDDEELNHESVKVVK